MIEKRTFGGIVADIIIWIIVGALALSCLMPLMNTPFLPGRCLETVRPWQRVPSETLRWRSTTISAAGRNRRRWKWSPKLLYPAHLL